MRAQSSANHHTHTKTFYFSKDTFQDFEDTLREKVEFDKLRNNEDALQEKCKTYLEEFKCTHYIKSILMGAVEYEEMTLEEYKSTFSGHSSIGAKMHQFGISASSRFGREVKKRHEEYGLTKVGSWDDHDRVVEEKVIDVEIAPIHKLIKTNLLRKALKEAVVKYRKERENDIFYIKCGTKDTDYYWKEESDGRISTTTEVSKAKKFCINITEGSHIITIDTFEDRGPKKRLTYSVSLFSSQSPGEYPPVLRENSDTYEQRLTLKHTRDPRGNMINPNLWMSEKRVDLYIRCHHFGKKGKFCIQKIDDSEDFELTIVPKSDVHNGRDVLMLFYLEKVENNDS